MRRWATTMMVVFVCGAAQAQEPTADSDSYFPQRLTAKDLLYACASSAMTSLGRERRTYCSGFISGVEETIRIGERKRNVRSRICVPEKTTARNLANVYIKYASQQGDELVEPAAVLVKRALQDAFPCK